MCHGVNGDMGIDSCEWWSGKDCTLGNSHYGVSSSGQSDDSELCMCVLSSQRLEKIRVSSKNERECHDRYGSAG